MKCFLTGLGPVKAKLLALQMHQLSFEDLITVEDGQKKKRNLNCFYSILANRRKQKDWFLWKTMHQSQVLSMLHSLNF